MLKGVDSGLLSGFEWALVIVVIFGMIFNKKMFPGNIEMTWRVGNSKYESPILAPSGEGEQKQEIPIYKKGAKMADFEGIFKESEKASPERDDKQSEMIMKMEEENMRKFEMCIEYHQKLHREDVEKIISQLELNRQVMEGARGRLMYSLPKYNGKNLEVEEWLDRVDAVTVGNDWGFSKLFQALPGSLEDVAKRAFDTLTTRDKQTKESFLRNLRDKIDPYVETRNKDLFYAAKKEHSETYQAFVDRLKMYIRRSGENYEGKWAEESMKAKVYECLTSFQRMIMNASVGRDGPLDKMVKIAEGMRLTAEYDEKAKERNTEFKYQRETKSSNANGNKPQMLEVEQPYHIYEYTNELTVKGRCAMDKSQSQNSNFTGDYRYIESQWEQKEANMNTGISSELTQSTRRGRGFRGTCGKCHQRGHMAKLCTCVKT